MGQYYVAVNITKKQYIQPHACGDGAKLMELGCSAMGTMSCLAILLADGNGRGGGDLRSENPLIGSWAGDKIVLAGDYADEGKFMPKCKDQSWNLYTLACEEFENISVKAMRCLAEDQWVRIELEGRRRARMGPDDPMDAILK